MTTPVVSASKNYCTWAFLEVPTPNGHVKVKALLPLDPGSGFRSETAATVCARVAFPEAKWLHISVAFIQG
jgi:hypothetical protein